MIEFSYERVDEYNLASIGIAVLNFRPIAWTKDVGTSQTSKNIQKYAQNEDGAHHSCHKRIFL